jgi:hypothetical protein
MMSNRDMELIPVVQRSYDLCAGLYEHVNRFPRAQRGLLGRVVLEDALQMLTLLTVANRRAEKGEALAEAGGRLDALRITLRLSKRLGFLSNGGYEELSRAIDEVGRMLGGWLKYETAERAGTARTPERGMASHLQNSGVAGSCPAGGWGGEQLWSSEATPRSRRAAVGKKGRSGGVRYTMTSPTIEKYLQLKLEHPQALVFVAVGAFCQTFFEDAVVCAQLLRFAVRNLAADSEPEKILACGVPKAKLDKYVSLLRQAGREVHAE